MIKRNLCLSRLPSGYLFPEINRRKLEFQREHPEAKLISLGIGNTTEPLTPYISSRLASAARGLGTREGYSGYGDEQGMTELRERIAANYYQGKVSGSEVFVSDGAKCDIGRLQLLFGSSTSFAVQDPSYPVYVDGGVILGQTGDFDQTTRQFKGVTYLSCTPENGFFPELQPAAQVEIIYFCSPNNPTGAVATRAQLQTLIAFAKTHKKLIVFDAAYAWFIQASDLPRSIYELEGAKEVAIEVNSFSKSAGFTGVRLGWSVVPNELCYADGTPVRSDWNRIMTTIFNGASNLAQHGGLAALDQTGLDEMNSLVRYYLGNAAILKAALGKLGLSVYGGVNAPYLWVAFPGRNSWQAFEELLERAHLVTTPGSGFGPAGEGFVRFSSFGHRESVEEAAKRLEKFSL